MGSTASVLSWLGIFLNFLAGMALTPQIVGIEKLMRLSGRIHRELADRSVRLSAASAEVSGRVRDGGSEILLSAVIIAIPFATLPLLFSGRTILVILGVVLLVPVYAVAVALYSVSTSFLWAIGRLLKGLAELGREGKGTEPAGVSLPRLLANITFVGPASVLLMFGGQLMRYIGLAISVLPLWVASSVVTFVVRTIEGEERQRSLWTRTAVTLYIVGNLLQLVAVSLGT